MFSELNLAKETAMAQARGMTVVDRTGERYGRLVVLGRADNHEEPSGAIRARWKCLCDCGGFITTTGKNLSSGTTQSCGCRVKEKPIKHGMSRTLTYRTWAAMIHRCTNPNHQHWDAYGGRGITVSPAWHSFEAFYADMGVRPDGFTLERIDNAKGYEPGNVRWASRLEQANNRRTNVIVTFKGQARTIAEWGRTTGLGKAAIKRRLDKGWPVERALSEPLHNTGRRRKGN
jgi:hypothetical protein